MHKLVMPKQSLVNTIAYRPTSKQLAQLAYNQVLAGVSKRNSNARLQVKYTQQAYYLAKYSCLLLSTSSVCFRQTSILTATELLFYVAKIYLSKRLLSLYHGKNLGSIVMDCNWIQFNSPKIMENNRKKKQLNINTSHTLQKYI